jgi:large subunit ribosomal protein L29
MQMKTREIRNLTIEELRKKLDDAGEELMKLRFRQATGELQDTSQIRLTRRTIARMKTELNERLRAEAMEGEK